MGSTIRWLAVAAALWRPNGNAIGALHTGPSGNRVMLCGGSLDNWGPRESPRGPSSLRRLRLMEGRGCAAVWVSTSSPPSVTMKSRSPKRTCALRAQLIAWVAIRGLIWNAQRPLPGAPTIGVSNKHQLVNLYLLRIRLVWYTKGHKVYTVLGQTSLCLVCCFSCY